MIKSIIACLILSLLGCDNKPVALDEEFITSEAALVNQLAVDGCGWHFTIPLKDEWVQFASDEVSQNKVDKIIEQGTNNNGLYHINVLITYRQTGKKKDVLCGWGKTNAMDEIEISSIKIL